MTTRVNSHGHVRTDAFRQHGGGPRPTRLRAIGLGAAITVATLFGGSAALAADGGLSAGAIDGNAAAASSKSLGKKCSVPKSVTASKVIVVDGISGSKATVRACQKSGKSYYSALSTTGYVGYRGIAAKGKKREGDGKTPSGVFGMGYGFGVKSKPSQFHGSKYVKVTKDHVWVDGKATKRYNTLQRKSNGYKGESMYQTPAYNYGQVIGYNPEGTRGKGSAIFLHVNTGSGKTAGCVSVSQSNLLKILRWEGKSTVQMAISA